MSDDTFGSRSDLAVGDRKYSIFALSALDHLDVEHLPYSLKILLENLLRNEDGVSVTAVDVEALATWDPTAEPHDEIAFSPARILMQDFTGVPAVVDLAAMRDAVMTLGRGSGPGKPEGADRTGDRPLGDRRPVRNS